MSFGFSVGDFIAAGKLIKDIITILHTSARSEYHELMLELHGLQRALDQIEHLKAPPERQIYVASIKVAALMCTHVLDDFAGKLKKFESLAGQAGNSKAKIWTQKLRWGFTMADEVRNLRAYVTAHVGSLNMRLLTEELSSTYVTGERVERTQTNLVKVRENTEATGRITQSIQSTLEKIATIITSEVIPQLKTLVEQVAKIWHSNARVVSLLVKLQESPTPALQYTWFQAPVKFEDALGRVIPIPSEFDWLKVESIIVAHFSTGSGHAKVAAGEYELFDPLNRSEVISKSNFTGLRPGMSLTMAFIIGRYSHALGGFERCPRPSCQSSAFTSSDGGKQCTKCNICFEDARTQLPLPYRDDTIDRPFEGHDSPTRTLSSWKRKRIDTWDNESVSANFHKGVRKERLCFKNIRLSHFPLPQTPPVGNVRCTPKLKRLDPRKLVKKPLIKMGHRSPTTIVEENSPKTHIDKTINSPRDNHGVEQKVDLIRGVSTNPNMKAILTGVNHTGVDPI
ncbi:hypothetical protein K432DRAFT_430119 [Lepidopterella palustris CBS 459.81]|uniref:Ubiquitin-like domain-containing protein n=1 Tax=Lepidopterella palustris CBS 459.81 TaxID=1314670 RepID=A0A8E2DZ28_9PEZI|nr:hypothetical protein K432DRAFT_430119 [Lepidopterella palustris CBS 459.81]